MKTVCAYCRTFEKDHVFQSEKSRVTLVSLTSKLLTRTTSLTFLFGLSPCSRSIQHLKMSKLRKKPCSHLQGENQTLNSPLDGQRENREAETKEAHG